MGFYTTASECECREKMHPPSKNRVWDFSTSSPICTRQFSPQVLDLHREKRPTPMIIVSGVRYYGYRYLHPELGCWISRDPIEEEGGLCLYAMLRNATVNQSDYLGLIDSATASFWAQFAQGNYTGAAAILEALEGALPAKNLAVLAAALAAAMAAEGEIEHITKHVEKLADLCGSSSPGDPNKDPKWEPVKGWLKEIRASIKNLKQKLKNLPKNKNKAKPIEDAIKAGEEALKKYDKPCPCD